MYRTPGSLLASPRDVPHPQVRDQAANDDIRDQHGAAVGDGDVVEAELGDALLPTGDGAEGRPSGTALDQLAGLHGSTQGRHAREGA